MRHIKIVSMLATFCMAASAQSWAAEAECVVQSVVHCAPDYCGPSKMPVTKYSIFIDPANNTFRGAVDGRPLRPQTKVVAVDEQQSIATGTGAYPSLDDPKAIAHFQMATASRFPTDGDRHFTLVVIPKNEVNDTEVWAGSCPWAGPAPLSAEAGQTSIPVRFQGKWNGDPKNCAADDGESRLTIKANRIEFYESSGPVKAVVTQGKTDVALISELSGEGHTWLAYTLFRLSADQNTLTDITRSEAPFARHRCASPKRS